MFSSHHTLLQTSFLLLSPSHDAPIITAQPFRGALKRSVDYLDKHALKLGACFLHHVLWTHVCVYVCVCVAHCWSRRRTYGKDLTTQHTSWSYCRANLTPHGSTWRRSCAEHRRSWTSLLINCAGRPLSTNCTTPRGQRWWQCGTERFTNCLRTLFAVNISHFQKIKILFFFSPANMSRESRRQ